MEAINKLSNLFGGNQSGKSSVEFPKRIKKAHRDITLARLPSNIKAPIFERISKAELSYERGMTSSAEDQLSQAERDLKKALKRRRASSGGGLGR